MIHIDSQRFPILDFLGYGHPLNHPSFKDITYTVEPAEAVEVINRHMELEEELQTFPELPDMITFRETPTPETVSRFPLFAFRREDAEDLGPNHTMNLFKAALHLWSNPAQEYPAKAEVVTLDMLMRSADAYEEPFQDWCDEAAGKGFKASGVLLLPHLDETILYVILYEGNSRIETAVALQGRHVKWLHSNFKGFISSAVSPLEMTELDEIAEERGCSVAEAYFEHKMYFILKHLYYCRRKKIQERLLIPQEIIPGNRKYGIDDIQVGTVRPCVIREYKSR